MSLLLLNPPFPLLLVVVVYVECTMSQTCSWGSGWLEGRVFVSVAKLLRRLKSCPSQVQQFGQKMSLRKSFGEQKISKHTIKIEKIQIVWARKRKTERRQKKERGRERERERGRGLRGLGNKSKLVKIESDLFNYQHRLQIKSDYITDYHRFCLKQYPSSPHSR